MNDYEWPTDYKDSYCKKKRIEKKQWEMKHSDEQSEMEKDNQI